MNESVDPIHLALTAPLAEALSASVGEAWLEAADLWFDVVRDPLCRPLALACGAEAALNAGLFDLAEYFRLGLRRLPAMPDFVAAAFERSAPVRDARKRYYSLGFPPNSARDGGDTARELLRLHLFPEAIRVLLAGAPYRGDLPAAAPLLARAYRAIGAHEAFIALSGAYAANIDDADLKEKTVQARRLLAGRADAPAVQLRRFRDGHPAGPMLGALIARATRAAA